MTERKKVRETERQTVMKKDIEREREEKERERVRVDIIKGEREIVYIHMEREI